MCCPTGGFPTIRHNEVRDILADLLTEVCSDVAVEPQLAPVSGEVFLAASTPPMMLALISGLEGCGPGHRILSWVSGFFHPDAPSYAIKPLDKLSAEHERKKKLEYAERIINVDRGTFTPLVFTTACCCAPECSRFVKRLCGLISNGDTKLYAETMTYVRCRLAFALLRSAIMCIRDARSSYQRPVNALGELAISEGRL